jgi:hypothetical protein
MIWGKYLECVRAILLVEVSMAGPTRLGSRFNGHVYCEFKKKMKSL